MQGIRPGGNLAFERLPDGSVVMIRYEKDKLHRGKIHVRFSHVFLPEVWTEVIAFVSNRANVDPVTEKVSSARMKIAKWFHGGFNKEDLEDVEVITIGTETFPVTKERLKSLREQLFS